MFNNAINEEKKPDATFMKDVFFLKLQIQFVLTVFVRFINGSFFIHCFWYIHQLTLFTKDIYLFLIINYLNDGSCD